MLRDWDDEFTLLCERCGYRVEGLDTAGACPECGKPIAESLPGNRPGTPYQQQASTANLFRTWWMTLRHPVRILRVVQVGEASVPTLEDKTLRAAALIFGPLPLTFTALFGAAVFSSISSGIEVVVALGLILPAAMLTVGLIYATLIALTRIEARGLRFIGRSRRARVDTVVADAIVAHGSVGWVVLAIGPGIAPFLMVMVNLLWLAGVDDEVRSWIVWACLFGLLVVLPVGGFLFFEFFAWLGLRELKYVNRLRPGGATAGQPSASDDPSPASSSPSWPESSPEPPG